MSYNIIRNFHGGWPQWYASLDDGLMVYIRIRHGDVWIGVGITEEEAEKVSDIFESGEEFCGVTDCVDALVALRKAGFYYVAPND